MLDVDAFTDGYRSVVNGEGHEAGELEVVRLEPAARQTLNCQQHDVEQMGRECSGVAMTNADFEHGSALDEQAGGLLAGFNDEPIAPHELLAFGDQ